MSRRSRFAAARRPFGARCGALAVVLACAFGAAGTSAETSVAPGINDRFLDEDLEIDEWVERFEVEAREIYVAREAIVTSLGLREGMTIADVGAGTGLFLAPFSTAVGKDGGVYAIDIAPRFLDHLRARAKQEGLENVRVVRGTDRSVELPERSVDVAFVCDVYHHFEYPDASLASLMRAIRPGGELVVIDFHRVPGKTREFVLEHVRAGRAVFQREIEAAGFEFVGAVGIEGLTENYVLRFRRPASSKPPDEDAP